MSFCMGRCRPAGTLLFSEVRIPPLPLVFLLLLFRLGNIISSRQQQRCSDQPLVGVITALVVPARALGPRRAAAVSVYNLIIIPAVPLPRLAMESFRGEAPPRRCRATGRTGTGAARHAISFIFPLNPFFPSSPSPSASFCLTRFPEVPPPPRASPPELPSDLPRSGATTESIHDVTERFTPVVEAPASSRASSTCAYDRESSPLGSRKWRPKTASAIDRTITTTTAGRDRARRICQLAARN